MKNPQGAKIIQDDLREPTDLEEGLKVWVRFQWVKMKGRGILDAKGRNARTYSGNSEN